MKDPIILEHQGTTTLITINNPKSHNALSSNVMNALIEALEALSKDKSVQAIVLTGAGSKAFCVGLDLKEIGGGSGIRMGQNDERTMGIEAPLSKAFRSAPQPIIAAVNGFAVTGGLEVAMACDFIVCSENAQFADTHALVGLLPGWGLSQKLPRLIGVARAKEFSFTGRYINAQEAYDLGLVNRVFKSEELITEAVKIADRIGQADPHALHQIKAMIDQGIEMPLGEALIMEGDLAQSHNDTVDLSYLEERLKTLRTLSKQ